MCSSQTKVMILQPIKTGKGNHINQSELEPNIVHVTWRQARENVCQKKKTKLSL